MPTENERVGIYGGTFSPVHSGHVRAAYAFLDAMKLDRLYVVPAAIPPHKTDISGADASARLEMVRLAFGDNKRRGDRLEVSDYEIKREGKSYSVYTLEHFSAPGRELYMLVGTDMFLTLPEWYRAEDIFRLSRIVLMRRERNDALGREINLKKCEYIRKYGAKIHIIDKSPIEISSTELRGRIRSGESLDGLIPDRVIKYIKENNLYR